MLLIRAPYTVHLPLLHGMATSRFNEWHTLVAALLGVMVTSFVYGYSTYSNALQLALGLTESQKELIGWSFSCTDLISFTAGLAVDRTSGRFCCLLGAGLSAGAYTVFGLVANNVLPVAAVPFCFAMLGLASYGTQLINAGIYRVLAKSFSGRMRSSVVSISKAYVGVATGLCSTIYVGLFPDDGVGPQRLRYIYFLAVLCGVLPLLVSPLLEPIPPAQRSQAPLALPLAWRLPALYGLSAALIVATLSSATTPSVGASIVLIILTFSPLAILLPSPGQAATRSAAADAQPFEQRVYGRSPLECGPSGLIRTPEAYLLYATALALQAGGGFITTNLGSMAASRSGPAVEPATAVAVFSCFQAAARLAIGALSERLVESGWPRTLLFPILMVLMAAAHAVLCVTGPAALLAGTALAGVAFGAHWPLLVLTITEIFGEERVASNYMPYDGGPSVIGGYLVSNLLASSVYEAHKADASATQCHGDACFQLANMVVVGLELACAALGAVLAIRTRVVYRILRSPRAEQMETCA